MKRRDFFYIAVLLPFTMLTACKKYDSWNTVVMGKVVDENNQPVEGMSFQFLGYERKGLGTLTTFDIHTQSDSEGRYEVAFLIPSSTDEAVFGGTGNDKFKFGTTHDLLRESEGKYVDFISYLTIPKRSYGETTIINFQVIKKR